MKTFSIRRWGVWIALVLATLGSTFASGPIAVYALVDKVIFEPNDTAPERIQIWGAFSVATGPYSRNYSAAQTGYLYYKLDKNQNVARATRTTWADLKKIAGTGDAVGFGGGYGARESSGRVRLASEKPKNPDEFPIGNPVIALGKTSQAAVIAGLKNAVPAK